MTYRDDFGQNRHLAHQNWIAPFPAALFWVPPALSKYFCMSKTFRGGSSLLNCPPNFSGADGAIRTQSLDASLFFVCIYQSSSKVWGKVPSCACGGEGKREHCITYMSVSCTFRWLGDGLRFFRPRQNWSQSSFHIATTLSCKLPGHPGTQSLQRVEPDLDLATSQKRMGVPGPKFGPENPCGFETSNLAEFEDFSVPPDLALVMSQTCKELLRPNIS
eukprot:1157850-Pelagomonas_calceolata.AAC.4